MASASASSKLQPLEVSGVELDAQPLADPLGEARRAVVVGEEPVGRLLDLAVDHLQDRVLGGLAVEQPLAERVDPLPLLVHDLVVFEQVLTESKLRSSTFFWAPSIRRETILLSIASPSSMPSRVEDGRDPLAGELPHQVVFEREEEPRRAGVALPAGAAAKLVIDPAALVPLGADDVQAAQPGDLAPLGLHLGLVLARRPLPRRPWGLPAGSGRAAGRPRPSARLRSAQAMNSGLPPRMMSVPRPAMLVAIVTAPLRPACATISASRSWYLAFKTWCVIPCRWSISEICSDFSIDVVPTRIGRPVSWTSRISSRIAPYFSRSVR